MIKAFDYYLKENLAKKTVPNVSMAKSMLEKSEIRLKRINALKIHDSESSIIFEDLYECLREAAQSLMELYGFKPYSHEALVSFLNENKLLTIDKVNTLNNFRILRNNSVYKAEKISLNKCIESLEFTKILLPEIKKKFKDLTNENPKIK